MNSQVDLQIERLGIHGEGVARHEGLTIFVEDALPGEQVRARLSEKKKTYARAKVVQILKPSPHRVQPICPVFGKCGGCQIMHLEYRKQLEEKRQRVVDAFERIGKIFDVDIQPCLPSPSPLAYRNKIQLPVREGMLLGLYARHSHDLVVMDHCFIHCDLGEKVLGQIRHILKASPLNNLKFVLIKTAVSRQQVLVVLVTETKEIPADLGAQIMAKMPEIKGVVQNINSTVGNVVLGQEFRTIAGQGWIEEKICGLSFRASAASFFQVNPAQAENLYQKVLGFLELKGDEIVLDAYCGVGTLSLILAKQAKEVIGIESVAEAIADARENQKRNGISNARFICGKAEEADLPSIDAAVINPPRKGCEGAFLEKLVLLWPKKVVYVSCDPATLARDLQYLCSKGYRIGAVQPFDMFPQTAHVETVVILSE